MLFVHNNLLFSYFFFFNDTATTEIYTLSLHDALPISRSSPVSSLTCASSIQHLQWAQRGSAQASSERRSRTWPFPSMARSEEHTSELQSQSNLVCRLLLEKKKIATTTFFRSCPSTSLV